MSNFGRSRTLTRPRGRSGFGRSRLGRPLRPYEWVPFVLEQTLIPTTSTVRFTILPEAVAEAMNSPTIMRLRALAIFQSQASTPSGVARGVIGAQVVDGTDIALHEPFTEGDSSDWFVWQPYFLSFDANSASIGAQGLYVDVDSKSRRRIGPRDHRVEMYVSNFGAAEVTFSIIGRALYKS